MDGANHAEMELTDYKLQPKLDDKVFAKPGE